MLALYLGLAASVCLLFVDVVYNRYFHPLSRYPGPFLASYTGLWKTYQVWTGQFEYVLLDLHRRHGKIVRIGPNHIDISDGAAIKTIYGAGRGFLKSPFYNAFTALRPNLFGARDEEVHSTRRRAVANGFSAQSIAAMETYMDECILNLIRQFDQFAANGEAASLRKWIGFVVMDILGELAFSKSFGVLESGDESLMPPIREHSLLGTMSGQTPWAVPYINKMASRLPIPALRRLIEGRNKLRMLAVTSVLKRIEIKSDRKDLLGRLLDELEAGTDSKGRSFDVVDVQTEAFAFIVAGFHTTAASTSLLFWHLLHNPETMAKLRAEVDTIPAPKTPGYTNVSTSGLSYLHAAIDESFRINPIFAIPMGRIVPEGGTHLVGQVIPAGTEVSVCVPVIHHDEDIFGSKLESFIPERWLDENYDRSAYLIPFGAGHRACLGRNIAMMEIHKIVVSLIARYDIRLIGEFSKGGMPKTRSFGVVDLDEELLVTLKRRDSIKA